ncbi:sugar ABC transporter substrate-binding protein [Streptomyces sp. NPDC005774]|uniref:sugar ABC transporter substrate-binding protein n=1 Tax=Streptomyces sp. NPDC005774 TaxID=3364728 RepID=UPI00369D9014
MTPSPRALRWPAVAAALGSVAAVGGCGAGAASGDGAALTIGFVNGDTSEFATCLQKAVEQEAKARGVTLKTANSRMDAAKELSNIKDMITRQANVLMVQTVNIDALEGDMAKAEAAGVPLYLASLATDDVSGILGAAAVDLKGLGALDAGWVAEDAGGEPVQVGVIAGAPGAASDLMVAGFTEALPDTAKVVADQPGMFNPVKAQDVAENMIEAHPDMDYVFVANEEMAFAARKVFDSRGGEDIKIVTENGTEEGLAAVEDGRFSATVANSPKVIGETAVRSTADLMEKGEKGKVSGIPLTLITKDNREEAPQYCPAG